MELLLPVPSVEARTSWRPTCGQSERLGPTVDDPLGMTSVELSNLGSQGEILESWMDLSTTEVNKGQVIHTVLIRS